MSRESKTRRSRTATRRPLRSVEVLESRQLLDGSYHSLASGPLLQDWSNTALIATKDDWSGVPSITGYLGDGLLTSNGVDPRILTLPTLGTVGVLANQTVTDSGTGAGPAEFEIADPVVAIRGGGNKSAPPAPAPSLLLFLDATGQQAVRVQFDLRDLDGSVNNSTQQVAVQYRLAPGDTWANVDQGYVDDATRGPSLSGLVTHQDLALPPSVDGRSQVQVRIVTTDSAGTDEWIGIDNINVTSTASVAGGSFSFDRASIRVSEASGVATLNVLRTGGTAGAATVPYQVIAGSAVAGENFVAASGVLNFHDDDESSLPLEISLILDPRLQGDLSLSVTLGSPDLGGLGVYPTIQVAIADAQTPTVLLNEVLGNPDGGTDNPFEFVEIKGLPTASLAGYYFVDLNGDSGTTLGIASLVQDLSGSKLGSNGLLVIKSASGGPTVDPASTVILNRSLLEQASLSNNSVTHLLVRSNSPIFAGLDFDTNDDGIIDLPSGAVVVDSVGWSDGGASDRIYSAAVLTQSSGTPDAASRFPHNLNPNSSTAWYNGDLVSNSPTNPAGLNFDPVKNSGNLPPSAALTPGAANVGSAVNLAPDSVDDGYTTSVETVFIVPSAQGVLANDSDPDDDLLVAVLDAPAVGGVVSLAIDGSFRFVPAPGFSGSASFTYHATDGFLEGPSRTVTIGVTTPNAPPSISIPAMSPTSTGHASIVFHQAEGAFVVADPDAGTDPIQVTLSVTHGTLTLSRIDGLEFSLGTGTSEAAMTFSGTIENLNAAIDGLTFVPNPTYYGDASLFASVDDLGYNGSGGAQSSGGTLVIHVENEAPIAGPDTANGTEDTPLVIAVLDNDSDVEGDALTPVELSTPAHGTLAIDGQLRIVYTPEANYFGTDSFTYRASDGQGTSAITTVSITIDPQNDAPIGVADTGSVQEDHVLILDVVGNDTDIDDTVLVPEIVTSPAHGSAVVLSDGTVQYTPSTDYFGDDSFSYQAVDLAGAKSDIVTVPIVISSVNDLPVALADSGSVPEDEIMTIDVVANDSDVESATLTPEIMTAPVHGTAIVLADRTIQYTPSADYFGDDSFTYRAIDQDGGKSVETLVSISVAAVDDPPIASGFSTTTTLVEDTESVIDVFGIYATDIDSPNLTASIESLPLNGTLEMTANGTFLYRPNANYNGPDAYSYRVSDGLSSSVGTFQFTVTPVNDKPVLEAPTFQNIVSEGRLVSLPVNATDVDDLSSTLTYTLGSDAPAGMSIEPTTGMITWLASDGPRMVTFTVIVTDSSHLSDTGTRTIIVQNVAPTVGAISDAEIPLGGEISSAGSFVDPGADTWTGTVDYGDGTGSKPLTLGPDKTFALNHVFALAGTFNGVVTVTDKDNGIGVSKFVTTVKAPIPLVTVVGGAPSVRKGVVKSISLILSDAVTNATTATYRLALAGRDNIFGTRDDKSIALKPATYNEMTRTITLTTRKRFAVPTVPVKLTVSGLKDTLGRGVDGDRDNAPGGTFSAMYSRRGLTVSRFHSRRAGR